MDEQAWLVMRLDRITALTNVTPRRYCEVLLNCSSASHAYHDFGSNMWYSD